MRDSGDERQKNPQTFTQALVCSPTKIISMHTYQVFTSLLHLATSLTHTQNHTFQKASVHAHTLLTRAPVHQSVSGLASP